MGKQVLGNLVKLFQTEGCPIVNYAAKGYITVSGARPSAKWSWGNKILMLSQGTQDARGYQQWQQVGRSVMKGRKAIYILRPLIAKRTEEKNGKIEERTFVHGFAALPVFRIEDTEIIDAAKWEESLKGDIPKQLPPLSEVAAAWGVKVFYDGTHGGEFGATDGSSYIRLCTADESTMFHELAHVAQKKIDGKLKGGQDTEQEVIAELTAAVLARMHGLNVDAAAYTYISTYVGSKNPKDVGVWCVRVLTKVAEIIDLIYTTKEQIAEPPKLAITP